jgi:iron complex outermembrane recepter protein
MDGTQIDRWSGRYPLAWLALCIAQATSLAGHQVATAAQDEPEEVILTGSRTRQNPVDIDRSGEISIADYLQREPISGSAINRSNYFSGNLGVPSDGGGMRFFHARAEINF